MQNRRIKYLIAVLIFLGVVSGGVLLAQGLGYFPRYPYRINLIAKELSLASGDLAFHSQTLKDLAHDCSCGNAQSQCKIKDFTAVNKTGVFGETCNNRKLIEETQTAIKDKTDQVVYLRELLKKEMASGLEAELKTLREDEANKLKENLDNLLTSSEQILAPARKNAYLLDEEKYSSKYQCEADCSRTEFFTLKACIFKNTGEQNPVKINFKVSAGLDDLELGKLGIKSMKLNLPDKIDVGDITAKNRFDIYLADLLISFDPVPADKPEALHTEPIVIRPPSPEVPLFSPSNYSCPAINSREYSCVAAGPESENYKNLKWYLETYSWLSEKCQALPGLTDKHNLPTQEKFNQCLDKQNVHLNIINQCDEAWNNYLICLISKIAGSNCALPSGICLEIKEPDKRIDAAYRECRNLYSQINEIAPVQCNAQALDKKCQELKEKGSEVLEPCKFAPLFTKELHAPISESHQQETIKCESQKLYDNPEKIGFYCPQSTHGSNQAKIKLPDIVIPDIKLPTFNFSPFAKVKLPNFIFEDLKFNSADLCNLDQCRLDEMVLDFDIPTLRIPTVRIPALKIPLAEIPGFPGLDSEILEVGMDDIDFPPIPFSLPNLNLADLITPILEIPEIPVAQPKITLDFAGLDIDLGNLLLGLVTSILPIPSGCIGGSISGIPLVISFPDFYFYWPRFPEMPHLCQNLNDFCGKMKEAVGQNIALKKGSIEKIFSNAAGTGIQDRLDRAALLYQKSIEDGIGSRLKEAESQIRRQLEESFRTARVENGMLKLNDVRITLGDIGIPMSKGNSQLAKIPESLKIPWPKSLTEIQLIKPVIYSLPSIPLSDLSYSKLIELRAPGLQLPSLSFDTSFLGNYAGYELKPPSGSSPYPTEDMDVNLQGIKKFKNEIDNFYNQINDILQ